MVLLLLVIFSINLLGGYMLIAVSLSKNVGCISGGLMLVLLVFSQMNVYRLMVGQSPLLSSRVYMLEAFSRVKDYMPVVL